MKKDTNLKFIVLLTGVLVVLLLVCILTFMKGNAQQTSEETPQQTIAPNETNLPNESTAPNKSTQSAEKKPLPTTSTEPNTSSTKAIISDKIKLTELDPNHGYDEEVISFTDVSPNSFMPTYEKNFGYQIVHLERYYVEVEVVNTGNTTLYINDDTLGFVLYNQGGVNVSGTKILEGEGPLKPKEKILVKVSASNPNTGMFTVALNGRENGQTLAQRIVTTYAGTAPLSDTTPLSVPYVAGHGILGWEGLPQEDWILTPKYNGLITGNGKIKIQCLGLKLLENESIDGLQQIQDTTGGYALVQFRLANTTNEVMILDELLFSCIYPDLDDRSKDSTITLNPDSEVLKQLGLNVPSSVEPNTIVDFYLPAAIPSSKYLSALCIQTNFGLIQINNVGTLMPVK